MKDLLFLAHRIPFPPNKGDKIRSFHLLRYLAERYRVHLGAFVDADEDWQHEKELSALCASLHLLALNPKRARIRSARGLLTREALSFPYYRDGRMARWVRERLATGDISRAFVFSSQMAQYLPQDGALTRVVDFCDVDSAKWEQYASGAAWPMSWVYRREAALLAKAEADIACEVDAALFVSSAEAALFRTRAPQAAAHVHVLTNGVDHQKFDPNGESFARPDTAPPKYLVFTGAMDYWANVDAVSWFANKVLPQVRASIADMGFAIVGSRPAPEVQQLAKLPGVIVTGSVPDVRPWIAHAQFVVAPLRIARGIQNKVLEGMAMAQPVVATSAALEGIADGVPPGTVAAAEEPAALAAAVVQMAARRDRAEFGRLGRAFVREHFDWTNSLTRVVSLLERAA